MKCVRRHAAMCLLTACLAALSSHSGAVTALTAADKQNSSRDEALEVLDWGFRIASTIPVKPHLADRSKAQYQALKAYVDMGATDELDARIANILDWRRGQLCAETGAYLARQGKFEKAASYLERAQVCHDGITGWHVGWQKERVKAAIAAAEVVRKVAQTSPLSKDALSSISIFDPVHPLTERYSLVRNQEDYEKAIRDLEPMKKSVNWEVQETAALTYIRILTALGQNATAEQAEEIKANVYEMAAKLPPLKQPGLYRGLSRAAHAAGQHDLAVQVLDDITSELAERELNARFDVAILVEVADARRETAGQPGEAAELLAKAEALLNTSELLPIDRLPALLSLVGGYARQNNDDKAWHYLRQALELVQAQPNRRPRATWLTDICIAVAQSRLPLPAANRTILLRELNRLEVDR